MPAVLLPNHIRHIVVEGPIGVGKTTLTLKLAEAFGFDTLFEQPEDNPFLTRFYQQPDHYALQTQLYFLFQRVKQLHDLGQSDLFSRGMVSDFMLEKDPLFAEITLDTDELGLYRQVYDSLAPNVPTPDLVIYLQAPVETLRTRIAHRGKQYEQKINPAYLGDLADAYSRYFLNYYRSPLLIVNAANLNLVENEAHLDTLLNEVVTTGKDRRYYNPMV